MTWQEVRDRSWSEIMADPRRRIEYERTLALMRELGTLEAKR